MRIATLSTLILFGAVCGTVWADGSGTLTYHGQTTQLKYAYAFAHQHVSDRSKQAITLALADKPFDTAKLDESPNRESELDHQLHATGINMVKVVLAPDGADSIVQWQAAGSSRGTMLSAYDFDLKQRNDKHIVGTLRSKRDSSDGGEGFPDNPRLDIRFAIDLAGPPNLGTPLSAGGGEPGKAYLTYNSALWKGDLDALSKADRKISIWIQGHRNDKNFQRTFSMLQDMQALREPKIRTAFVKGSKATLEVSGTDTGGGNCEATVVMSKEDGRWGVEFIRPHHLH